MTAPDTRRVGEEDGRSPSLRSGSGCQPSASAAVPASSQSGIPNAGDIYQHGWLSGHAIRTARKPYKCDERSADCLGQIACGDRYVEGDVSPDRAGGFGRDRVCLACAATTAPASGIEAATADETRSGSAEGESPALKGDAQ